MRKELYDVTRGIWHLAVEKVHTERTKYAFAVYDGEIKEVYEIQKWHRAGTTPYATDRRLPPELLATRYEFTGKRATGSIRDKYVGKTLEGGVFSESHKVLQVLEMCAATSVVFTFMSIPTPRLHKIAVRLCSLTLVLICLDGNVSAQLKKSQIPAKRVTQPVVSVPPKSILLDTSPDIPEQDSTRDRPPTNSVIAVSNQCSTVLFVPTLVKSKPS